MESRPYVPNLPNWAVQGLVAVHWAATAFVEAEKNYPRIMSYWDLWILKAHVDELSTPPVERKEDAV